MLRGKQISLMLLLASVVFTGLATQGCVTAGEYNRIKDQLAKANETIDLKDQRIEELDHELMVKQEEYLVMQDEIGRFRENSDMADQLIADLKKQLENASSNVTMVDGGDAYTLFPVAGGVGIRMQNDVLFDSGSDSIKTNGKSVLDLIINEIKNTSSNQEIKIVGHTDTDPVVKTKAKYPRGNIQLSTERAISVFEYLRQKGIAEKRMSVVGCGPSVPLFPNNSTQNKQLNRRVEIVIQEK